MSCYQSNINLNADKTQRQQLKTDRKEKMRLIAAKNRDLINCYRKMNSSREQTSEDKDKNDECG